MTGARTDQAFTFVGAEPLTKHAGQLHAVQSGAATIVEGVVGALHAGDFIL